MLGKVRALGDAPRAAAGLSATLLVAAAVTLGSMFTPFVTQGCIFCPVDYTIPARSVFQGLDGWIALVVGVALLFFSVLLTIRRERRTAIVCAVLAAAATRPLHLGEGRRGGACDRSGRRRSTG